MVPSLTNTGNTEEDQVEVSFGHPCLEVLMGKSPGGEKEAKARLGWEPVRERICEGEDL